MNTNSLYIASMEPEAGKLLITMGIMEYLSRRIEKVAFFRPVIDESRGADKDINLIRAKYCPDMSYEECYGFDTEDVKLFASQGNLKEFYVKLLEHFNRLLQQYDFVLCEGLNSSGFLASFNININLEIARNLGSSFIAVINGKEQDDDAIQEEIKIAANIIKKSACHHFSTFVNRIPSNTHETMIQSKLQSHYAYPVFLVPDNNELDKPTLSDIQNHLNAVCVMGSSDDLYRVVRQVKIATMTVEHFLGYIEDGDLIIVGGDRADILLASITTLSSHNYPNLAGILLTGGFTPEANMLKLLKGMELPIPILSVPHDTFNTTRQVETISAVLNAENQRKIALALGLFDTHVNAEMFFNRANISICRTMTPIMFEHNLFERAQTRRMTIVLPEAGDERILRAVEILLRRQVVDVILLGNEDEIRSHSASLGLDIEQASIINPPQSELLPHYTDTLYALRKHKGLTPEAAADAMLDGSY